MSHRTIYRLVCFGFILLVFASAVTAVAASNTVPSSRLDDNKSTINANALKPAQCAALTLTSIIVCPSTGGNCTGTNASELILGSPFADTIQGRQGDDCILGGGGNDSLRGNNGTDVCIGGPGNDSFQATCETQIQ